MYAHPVVELRFPPAIVFSWIRCFGYFALAFISDGTEQPCWSNPIYPLTDMTYVMGFVQRSLFESVNEHALEEITVC